MAKKLSTLELEIRTNTAKFRQGIDRAERKMDRFGKRVKGLQGGIIALGGLAGFGYLATRTLSLADDFTVLQSRIQNATRDTGDYLDVSRRLSQVSATTGSALADTVDVFQRLTQSRQDLNATNEELLNLTELVQKLGVISGASSQALSAGLLQFGQGLSAGVFRAEEFNSIVENLPAVANAIAKSLGKSPGELRKMVLEGKLLSKDVMEAIISQSQDINSQFEEMPISMQRAGVSLSNSFSRFLGSLDQAAEGTGTLAKAMQLVTESLDNWSDRLTESELDETMRRRANAAKDLADYLARGADISKGRAKELRDEIDRLDETIIAANRTLAEQKDKAASTGAPVEEGTSVIGATEAAIKRDLERLQEGILSAEELENKRYADALERLTMAEDMKLETIMSYDEIREGMKKAHDDRITNLENEHWSKVDQIRRKNMTALDRFTQMSWKGQTKTVLGQMVAMTQGVAQSSKTMFNINKAAALSEAVIAGFQGVAKTLGAYPYPINIGMAALSAAASAAQVSAIAGTSFGGGGSAPSLAGSGGGSETINTVDVTTPTAATASATLTVNLGDFDLAAIPDTALRTLLTKIEDARTDMGDNTQVIYA